MRTSRTLLPPLVLGISSDHETRQLFDQFLRASGVWRQLIGTDSGRFVIPRGRITSVCYRNPWLRFVMSAAALVGMQCLAFALRRRLVVVSSDGIGRFRILTTTRTRIVCYWWNDAEQAEARIHAWGSHLGRGEYVHVITHVNREPVLPAGHTYVGSGDFCLIEVARNESGVTEDRIVFAGMIDLGMSETMRSRISAELRVAVDRVVTNLVPVVLAEGRGSDAEQQWVSLLESVAGDDESLRDDLWRYLGNHLRFAFLEGLAASSLGTHLDLYLLLLNGEPSPVLTTHMMDPDYRVVASRYSQARVVLDLGSRLLTHPIECYERTTRIIASGYGLLRYADIDDSRVFRCMRGRRQFATLPELVAEASRLLSIDAHQWRGEGDQLKANYELIQRAETERLAPVFSACKQLG